MYYIKLKQFKYKVIELENDPKIWKKGRFSPQHVGETCTGLFDVW
jgi:hypothetical protein